MKINVGSKNQVKVQAVADTIKLYPKVFIDPQVSGIDVKVEEFGHPNNINEIFKGAIERAKNAFHNCDYSFGLEGGFIEVKDCPSGYMEISGCVIFDGKNKYFGLSSAFEWPINVTKFVLEGKGDASLAYRELGYTSVQKRGAEKGGILGELTNFRLTREDQIKQSIIMAMIYLEKKELR